MTTTQWTDAGNLADLLGGSKERLIEAARQNVAYREYSVEERECPKEERTHNRQRYQYRATSWADSGSRQKHRIPKPPLTIEIEEGGDSLDADTSGRLARLEQRIDTLSKKITWDEEDLDLNEELVQQVFRRIDDTLVSQTEQIRYELRGVVEDKVGTLEHGLKQVEKVAESALANVESHRRRITTLEGSLLDVKPYLNACVKEHVEMMIKATFEMPDHGARIDAGEERAKAAAASIEMLQTRLTELEGRFELTEQKSAQIVPQIHDVVSTLDKLAIESLNAFETEQEERFEKLRAQTSKRTEELEYRISVINEVSLGTLKNRVDRLDKDHDSVANGLEELDARVSDEIDRIKRWVLKLELTASNPITRLSAAAGAFVSTLKGGQ